MSAAAACTLLVLLTPLLAYAQAPHVATTPTPDTCAMCHRAHTAAGDFGRVDPDSWEMESSALGMAVPLDAGDTALCYVCHGVDALGSGTPVGVDFAKPSAHSLAPAASPFGPSVKYCSSCHDSHGADESAPGVSYAALLRARTSDGTRFFRDSDYCGTCHEIRPASRFPGVSIYEKTQHYGELPDPASGTLVRCSICHQGHGSSVAPLIAEEITPPSVTATEAVAANDRTFCLACHPADRDTYPGETLYAAATHALSAVVGDIPGEWPEDDAKRRVGECQACHAPMGRDDGTGEPIQTLLEMKPSELCLSCHGVDGVAETDLASLQYPPTAAADLELVAGFRPDATTAAFGTLALWGTEAGAAPRDLVGPRFFKPETSPWTSGVLAVGDVDDDGTQNVVVADRNFAQVTVFSPDPLKGLSAYGEPALVTDAIADHLVVADVVDDASGRPEICMIAGDTLYVYRYDMAGNAPIDVDSYTNLGLDVTGLAAGDLDADGFAELVITDADAAEIHVLTESGGTPGTLESLIPAIPAKAGVRGPSIGDIDVAPGVEIAVANALEVADHVTVYGADGIELDSATLTGAGAAQAWATLIADVLPGATPAGADLAVAANGASGSSYAYVFNRSALGGLGSSVAYPTATGTGSLAAGDIDGDTYQELIVGNGGYWSRDGALATPPSIQVFQHDAEQDAFDSHVLLEAGGVERAGTAPSLALADFGGVGPSRHPVEAVADSHVATETAPFARHVECVDCHNVHLANSANATAPTAYGEILGTYGATSALVKAEPIGREYELCYKCHSAYAKPGGLAGAEDISALVDPGNPSVHAVEAAAGTSINVETFVGGGTTWNNSSILYCTDCHSTSSAAPSAAGPHASSEAPILRSPYLGAAPNDADGLCYDCHKASVYFTGVDDTVAATGSSFRDSANVPLHRRHASIQGFGCASCHDTHGSLTNERLIRAGIDFDETASTCTGPCHPSPDGGITPGISYAP